MVGFLINPKYCEMLSNLNIYWNATTADVTDADAEPKHEEQVLQQLHTLGARVHASTSLLRPP